MSRSRARGFSLIEILMVMAIILILGAMVCSFSLRAKAAADQASAQQSVRAIQAAELEYLNQHPDISYVT